MEKSLRGKPYKNPWSKYTAIHNWIIKNYGNAPFCSFDITHKGKRFDWANISGEYKRDINDYIPLCVPCHRKFDFTEQYRMNLRKCRVNKKKVKCLTLKGQFIKEYESLADAGRAVHIPYQNISEVLLGRQKTAAGYLWTR